MTSPAGWRTALPEGTTVDQATELLAAMPPTCVCYVTVTGGAVQDLVSPGCPTHPTGPPLSLPLPEGQP